MDELTLSYYDNVAYYSGAWMSAPWPDYPQCPCGLSECLGQKLRHKTQHVTTCVCKSCSGREANKSGHRGQDRTHRALGGTGRSRNDEERNKPYTVEVTFLPETKSAGEVPESFKAFVGSEWFRKALNQAERGAPIGSAVIAAVALDCGARHYLVADLTRHLSPRVLPHSTSRRPAL